MSAAARDLAWCRAAFRDLDAPLPGRPRSVDAVTQRRDWTSGPVGPGPLAAVAGSPPSTAALVARVVAASGLPSRRIDTIGATLRVWDEITRLGVELLQSDPAAARALSVVRERWDLEEPMLWHVFTYWGELGLRARREVVRRLYTGGRLERDLTAAVASGALLRY